jgi:predicted dehydrogenase
MTPLRIAVIGAGGIARRHVANLSWFPGARLVGIADPDLTAADSLARHVAGTKTFANWRQMLDKVAADAVMIFVPPFAHGEPELAAADRDLPFFVEKPIAADLATAERIAEAVIAHDLVTAVGYHWRYLDTTERAAELLAASPAQLVMGYWWDATPPRAWWVRQATSGGQMVEQTTHIFDLARVLVGEAEVVSTTVRRAPGRRYEFAEADVADASIANLVFETGAIGAISSTHLLRWPHRIGLHLIADGMVLELSESELMVDVGAGRPLTRPSVDPSRAELRDFLAAASGGENVIRAPFAEALRTQRLTVAATAAADPDLAGGRAGSARQLPGRPA